jgi:hypothetical protein
MMNLLDQAKIYIAGGLILLLVLFFFLWRIDHQARITLTADKARLEASLQAKQEQAVKTGAVEKVAADFPIPKLKKYDPNLPKHFSTGDEW